MAIVDELVTLLSLREDPRNSRVERGMRTALAGLKRAALGLTAAFGGLQLGFGSMAKEMAGSADAAIKFSRIVGVTVEELQELRYAAQRSGVQTRTFDLALQRFTRRSAEAAAGTGEAKDALAELGVQFRDQAGDMRPTIDLFQQAANGIAQVEDPAVRLRLAFKLFDAEGARVVNMLTDGADGLAKLRARARELGFIIPTESAILAEKLVDQFGDLRAATLGWATVISTRMWPWMIRAGNAMSSWLVVNREIIAGSLAEILDGIAQGFSNVFGWIRSGISWVRDLIPDWARLNTEFDLTGPAARITELGLLAAAGALGIAAARVRLFLASFGKWATILFFAVLILEDLWKEFRTGKSVLGDFWRSTKESTKAVIVAFSGVTAALLAFLAAGSVGLVATPLGLLLLALAGSAALIWYYWDDIVAVFWRAVDAVSSLIAEMKRLAALAIPDWIKEAWEWATGDGTPGAPTRPPVSGRTGNPLGELFQPQSFSVPAQPGGAVNNVSSEVNANITVNGARSPTATARAVKDRLSDLQQTISPGLTAPVVS